MQRLQAISEILSVFMIMIIQFFSKISGRVVRSCSWYLAKCIIGIIVIFVLLPDANKATAQNKSPFHLQGPTGKTVSLFKREIAVGSIKFDDQGKSTQVYRYTPIRLVSAGEKIELEPATYTVANECSKYTFVHNLKSTTIVYLSKLTIDLPNQAPDQTHVTKIACLDFYDNKERVYENGLSIDLLPGQQKILIGGRPVIMTGGTDASKSFQVALTPVQVTTPSVNFISRYFITSESSENVMSAAAGNMAWLLPGNYTLELNGTRQKILLEDGKAQTVPLGILRINSPAGFNKGNRALSNAQPVFVYLQGGSLLSLDTDYPIFPGVFQMSIEGSEIQRSVSVAAHQKAVVETNVGQINAPPCTQFPCKTGARATIHKSQKAFPLMTVDLNTPFLVFPGQFQYSVAGARGLYRTLKTGHDLMSVEALARLKLNWQVKLSNSATRTDSIRIDGAYAPNFGKSLDMLTSKPKEMLLPPGAYSLVTFVGESRNELRRIKSDFTIAGGETKEITVTLIKDKRDDDAAVPLNTAKEQSAEEGDEEAPLPTKLVPVRR